MIDRRAVTARDGYRQRINRAPSPLLMAGLPWATIMLGSLLPLSPIIASAPVLPPIGFMLLLAWRVLRPGMLPLWAGFPLGLFDDLFSGQPFGSAALLWSVAMLALEPVDIRFRWRGFIQDWLVAGAITVGYILLMLLFANLGGGQTHIRAIIPQAILSLLAYPVLARFVAWLDRLRLIPLRSVGG